MNKQISVPKKQIYEKSADMYRTINHDGIIIECNNAYAKKLGYSKREVIGKSIFDHVPNSSFMALKNIFETWKSSGDVSNMEIWLERKDGGQFPVLLSASTLYDKKGKIIGSNTVLRDISELYNSKIRIEELKARKLEIFGQIAARVLHDLKNSAALLKVGVERMKQEKFSKNQLYTQYLKLMELESRKIVTQLDDIKDYLNPKPLNEKKHSLLKIIKSAISSSSIPKTVSISLPKNNSTIFCDGLKLEMVMMNLISNASQAMSGKGKIVINAKNNKKSIVISVQDTGPGIPKNKLPKIFEPLFTTREIGTGLGLTSCKSIIEQHGGSIDVKTKVGEGTIFTIHLPNHN